MASYQYDEAGTMAIYFTLTFLFLILAPLTLSLFTSSHSKLDANACQCQSCIDQRAQIRKRESRSFFLPNIGNKTIFVLGGWSLFAFLAYRVSNAQDDTKVYDPFEILDIATSATQKEIKSRYKKLSKLFHPDKVKLALNQTMESVEAHFVEITKAYKSLTDETIRKNWELYGHPDGRQEVIAGIAIPKWIVEGKNSIWVLGVYGLVFGGALPAIVGQWWFGSRKKTKDGIEAETAATFFKSIKEESAMDDVVVTLGNVVSPRKKINGNQQSDELKTLEATVRAKWDESELGTFAQFTKEESRKRSLILLYAHLFRLPIQSPSLQKEQADILLHTPALLNALLIISAARNWLSPALSVMRLHAYVTQAIPPGQDKLKFAQLPGIEEEEALNLPKDVESLDDLVRLLEGRGDKRVQHVRKAVERWGRLEVEEVSFKVIGERIVTPSSIVYLLVKIRLSSQAVGNSQSRDPSQNEKKYNKINEEMDEEFLNSRKDAEDMSEDDSAHGWAHAPHWPASRKPGWWIVLADDKLNRTVVPPMKVTDVPFSNPSKQRNYRSYKMQLQAPQGVGLYTWKVYLVSDTFVGEEIVKDILLKVDDPSALNADEQALEDEISDPEEDSLAGQMAAMRGGAVKKQKDADDDSDDSSTDDDKESDDDSSDSD